MTALYRHFSKDHELLYVGISLCAFIRLAQHRVHSIWFNEIATVTIERFSSREEALQAETRAIKKEGPKYNLAQTSRMNEARLDKFLGISRDVLTQKILEIKPINNINEVAKTLNTQQTIVYKLIDDGKLGHVITPSPMRVHYKTGEPPKPRISVTGWQLLEYIEHLHEEYRNKKPPLYRGELANDPLPSLPAEDDEAASPVS